MSLPLDDVAVERRNDRGVGRTTSTRELTSLRPKSASLWRVVAIVSCAASLFLVAKGIGQFLWHPGDGYDQQLQWAAAKYYVAGQDPFPLSFEFADHHGPVQSTVDSPRYLPAVGYPREWTYPPSSTLTEIALYAGWSYAGSRAVYVVISLAALVAIGWVAGGIAPDGGAQAWAFAGLVLLNLGYEQTLLNGNFGVLVSALLLIALALKPSRALAAGGLLGVALVKPTISAPFAVMFAVPSRWRTVVVAGTYCAISVAVASTLTGVGPMVLVHESLEGTARFAQAPYAIWQVLRRVMPVPAALAVNAVVVVMPFLGLLTRSMWRRSVREDWLNLAAVAAVTARLFTYHNTIDNVLLTFLVLALVHLAARTGSTGAATMAAAVVVSVLVPYAWVNSLVGHLALYAVWIAGAGYIATAMLPLPSTTYQPAPDNWLRALNS